MLNFLKKIFCKHEYKYLCEKLILTGTKKIIVYECKKCGKQKCKFV